MRTYDDLTPYEREKYLQYHHFCSNMNQGYIVCLMATLTFFSLFFISEMIQYQFGWLFLLGMFYVLAIMWIEIKKDKKLLKMVFGFTKETEYFSINKDELKISFKEIWKEVEDINKPEEMKT